MIPQTEKLVKEIDKLSKNVLSSHCLNAEEVAINIRELKAQAQTLYDCLSEELERYEPLKEYLFGTELGCPELLVKRISQIKAEIKLLEESGVVEK